MNPGLFPCAPGLYVSQILTWVPNGGSAGAISTRHGLGARKVRCSWALVCLRPNNTYQPGDTLELAGIPNNVGDSNCNFSFWSNAQECGFSYNFVGASPQWYNKLGTAAFTALQAQWGLQVVVEVLQA